MADEWVERGGRLVGGGPHPLPRLVRVEAPAESPDEGAGILQKLAGALDTIDAPAIVVARDGRVLGANVLGAELLSIGPSVVRVSLCDMVATGSAIIPWSLTPLRGAPDSIGFLAILHMPPREAATVDTLASAILRWKLTQRQGQVLELVSRGRTNAEVGQTLEIGEGTVEFHLSRIFNRAGVENRTSLLARLLDRPARENTIVAGIIRKRNQ